jgi:putative transposase
MIEKDHPRLSVRRQAELLGVNRNRLRPRRPKANEDDVALMAEIDRIHTEWPVYGSRKLCAELFRRTGRRVGRGRMRRLMRLMGIEAVAPRPRTSVPAAGAAKYPYLLRGVAVERPDQAWCVDITYLPLPGGYCYLVAVMDWHSRAVLGWSVSNTLDTGFCLEALAMAVRVAGCVPGIINTDQGCQFTSREWIAAVEALGARVSMDGRGRWLDNVFIERLWRSLKYEGVLLAEHRNVREMTLAVDGWLGRYNRGRIHQSHRYATPWEVYRPAAARAA